MLKTQCANVFLCTSILLSACIDQGNTDEPTADYRARLTGNGKTWNGKTWNGKTWNGKTWNGKTWNGKTWNGKTWNGKTFSGISISGSEIVAVLDNGAISRGKDLIGATFQTYFDPGPELYTFKIDDAYQEAGAGLQDIWWYKTSYKSESASSYSPVCTNAAGVGDTGVFLSGMYWDETTGNRIDQPDSFTFACADGVLAKCTHIGYRPWATGTSCKKAGSTKDCRTVSLKDHHQACTRMLRADYCGDGVPHTLDGTVLDIFDYLQPPVQLREENWQMESRWIPTGATCLTAPRHPELLGKMPFSCTDASGKERKLSACNPYETAEDKRGLIVSTFPKATPAK
jgi:hypothetical protein